MHNKPIATIDCETDPFLKGRIPKPFLWDIYDGMVHRTFRTVEQCIEFLGDKDWIVYAHNGGKFDYHMPGFLNELDEHDEIMVINGRLSRFQIGCCEFRDSMNILPFALKQFDKLEIDYAKMEADVREKHMAEIVEYLHRDTESLYRLVTAFRNEYGNGLTLAGSAMKYWQKHFKQKAPRSTPKFYDDMHPFYYGGRVQPFKSGLVRGPIQIIDINSAYPRAMLEEHPISIASHEYHPGVNDAIIMHSMYHIRAVSWGALPWREKKNGPLHFPKDNMVRDYHVTGWELKAALETNTIDVKQVIVRHDFFDTINFKGYVDYFYEMKLKSLKNSTDYIFAKLFLNSLYGKFASNPEEYYRHRLILTENVPDTYCLYCEGEGKDADEVDCPWCHGRGHNGTWAEGELGNWTVMRSELPDDEKRYYNLATAASITGWVRAYLWSTICKLKQMGCVVLYCDTDSIAYQGPPPREMGIGMGKDLGEWAYEGCYDRGGIGGKKLYAFEKDGVPEKERWKKACKGARLTGPQIMRIAKGDKVLYEADAPSFNVHGKSGFVKRWIGKTSQA